MTSNQDISYATNSVASYQFHCIPKAHKWIHMVV